MNCNETQERISAYIDNECSEQEKIMFEKHILSCQQCKADYEMIQSLVNRLGSIEDVELPDDFHQDLMSKIELMMPSRKSVWKKINYRSSMIAAALILMVTIAIFGSNTLFDFSMKKSKSMEAPTNYESMLAEAPEAADQVVEEEVQVLLLPEERTMDNASPEGTEGTEGYGNNELPFEDNNEQAIGSGDEFNTTMTSDLDVQFSEQAPTSMVPVDGGEQEQDQVMLKSVPIEGDESKIIIEDPPVESPRKITLNPVMIGILFLSLGLLLAQMIRIRKNKK